MNRLHGKIFNLTTSGNLTLVDVEAGHQQITAVIIGAPEKAPYLKEDNIIELLFNESEVAIGKGVEGSISLNNQLSCTVNEWNEGDIFTCVKLSFNGHIIHSLITTRSFRVLNLKHGDPVTAYIKINEVFLKESDKTGIDHDYDVSEKETVGCVR